MTADRIFMTANNIQRRIASITTHFLFIYNEKTCGVDPFSKTNFDMWCGDDAINVSSIDEVMDKPFFDGKSLREIAKEIEITSV